VAKAWVRALPNTHKVLRDKLLDHKAYIPQTRRRYAGNSHLAMGQYKQSEQLLKDLTKT